MTVTYHSCDHCSKYDEIPSGWLYVVKDPSDINPWVRKEFCSWECVRDYADDVVEDVKEAQ